MNPGRFTEAFLTEPEDPLTGLGRNLRRVIVIWPRIPAWVMTWFRTTVLERPRVTEPLGQQLGLPCWHVQPESDRAS